MKISLLLLLPLAALPLLAPAQSSTSVVNGNLESWQTRNGVELPDDWVTFDDLLATQGLPPLVVPRTVTKVADAHGGSFAAQLQNQTITLPRVNFTYPAAALRGLPQRLTPTINRRADELTLPGVLLKASTDTDGQLVSGIPYTSQPARLQFWYKLLGSTTEADSSAAVVALTNKTNIVASAVQILVPQTVYTLVDAPLTYISGLRPDTLQMTLVVAATGNSDVSVKLLVDDVQLVGTVTSARASVAAAALQIYPNPSVTGEFSLASLTDPTLATAPFTITDAAGRQVLRQAAAPNSAARGRLVDLRSQHAGVYLLHLETPAGPVVSKLVIQ